jgi:hypothetical protein
MKQYHQAVHKLITSHHSKHCRPSGMLIHGQNSYAPSGKQRTGRHEAQSHESVNKVKNPLYHAIKSQERVLCDVCYSGSHLFDWTEA